jgi:hypothetical protein
LKHKWIKFKITADPLVADDIANLKVTRGRIILRSSEVGNTQKQ